MKRYGLLGYPLSHSFSRAYFNDKFEKEGLDAHYDNYDIPTIDKFPEILIKYPELAGLNVTIPYKQAVMQYLDALDKEAEAIGAVNVIKFSGSVNGKKKLIGYNTDFIGFMESAKPMIDKLKSRLSETGGESGKRFKALILGTGGASKAVCHGLRKLGVETLFVSRTQCQGCVTYEELKPEHYAGYRIIVNTTPLGMFPKIDTCPALDYENIGRCHLLFDVVYNPAETLFMKLGSEKGAIVCNGLEMLHLQAEAAWKIWNS